MKRSKLFLVLGITLLLYGNSTVAQNRYYYAYNEQIVLQTDTGRYVISYKDGQQSNVQEYLSSFGANTGFNFTIWNDRSNYCIKNFNLNLQQVKALFNGNDSIRAVQSLYKTVDGAEMIITNEIVVKFKNNISQSTINQYFNSLNVAVKKITSQFYLITVAANADALDVANAIQESGQVIFSHPDFISKTETHQTLPTDPYFVNQFYLHNTGQTMTNGHSGTPGADINAPEAWDITKGNANIVVAVLDEGVVSNHPDLPNSRQIRLAGSNFADSNTPNDPSPTGDDNHGTACAGVIAATHNNEGIAGIAPNCRIMPVKIPFGIVPASVYAEAITFAKENGADIISNSWGYGSQNPNLYPVIVEAIRDAALTGRGGKGCVVVFASGNNAQHSNNNDGYVDFPSNVTIDGVLTVGASDRYDNQADYSGTSNLSSPQNQIIDIVAPSHRAYSCHIPTETSEAWSLDIPGNAGYNPVKKYDCYPIGGILPVIGSVLPSSGTNYLAYTGHFGGTSCSCPQVAAVAALVLSINSNLTQKQVSDIILSTARKAGGYNYQNTTGIANGTWNAQMGHGVLDTYAAVQMAQMPLATDLMIGDSPEDIGLEPNMQTNEIIWDSPNIWVRHQNDGGLVHQNPEYDPAAPSYVYVRVKNISKQASSGSEKLYLYWAKASTALSWPYYWTGNHYPDNGPLRGDLIAIQNIPVIPVGGETIIRFPWAVPNPVDYHGINDEPWHFCLLSRIVAENDPMTYPETDNLGDNTRNNNNIAWRNVSIIELESGNIGAVVAIENFHRVTQPFRLLFKNYRSASGKYLYLDAEITIHLDNILAQAWARGGKQGEKISLLDEYTILIKDTNASLDNLILAPYEAGTLFLQFNILTGASVQDHYTSHIIQMDGISGEIIGGEVYEIYKSDRDPFYADAGQDITADKHQAVVLSAQAIGEPAIYNWYDQSGALISEGADFTTSVTIAQKYKLEVIALADGYKDYAEVNVKLKPNRLETVYPNPVLDQITVEYRLNEAATAYLSIANYYYSHISDNYILDTGAGSGTFNIGSYPAGIYTISLICNGQIADSKIFVKQ